jgi:acetylornithine deacetylase/succinyl-diaminopimelate desuccinylase-like protein
MRDAESCLFFATLIEAGARLSVARFAPTGMIFIPSRGGISHLPKEYSSWEHISGGAEVLYRTILALDAQLNRN